MDPIRCYSCGKVLPHARYKHLVRVVGLKPEAALDQCGLACLACRSHVAFSPDHIDRQLMEDDALRRQLEQAGGRIVYLERTQGAWYSAR